MTYSLIGCTVSNESCASDLLFKVQPMCNKKSDVDLMKFVRVQEKALDRHKELIIKICSCFMPLEA